MAHLSAISIFAPSSSNITLGRKPTHRRGPCIVSAQMDGNYDPNEAQRPLGNNGEIPRFFAVDGNPPSLEQDWRLFRAQLVAKECTATALAPIRTSLRGTWAHTIPHPEPGCLLIARNTSLGMFSHSVVLVTEHDDTTGTSALVLNMPTPLYISNLGLEEDITAAFGRSPLFIGGPMNRNLLHVLHGRGDVDGAMRIIDGVFAGGVESASELCRLGLAKPDEFKLLAGYSGWGPYQLSREIAEGSWWVVAASHNLILDCLKESGAWNPLAAQTPEVQPKGDVKFRCWEKCLQAAGIDY